MAKKKGTSRIVKALDGCKCLAEMIIALEPRIVFRKKIKIRALILVERDMREGGGWWLPSQFHYDSYDIQCQQATTEERQILREQLPILKKLWAQEDQVYCSNGNKPLIAAYL